MSDEATERAEEIGGPSKDYERPDKMPTDADPEYEEGDEEPSGLEERDDQG